VATLHTALPWAGQDRVSQDAVGVVARASLSRLRPGDHWVRLTIADPATFSVAAGLILELDRDGFHTVVAPPVWKNQFGHEQFSTHPVDAQFTMYDAAGWAAAQAAQPASGTALATAAGAVLTAPAG
jgi:hypothetical protein